MIRVRVDAALIGEGLTLAKDVCIDISKKSIEHIESDCEYAGDIYIPSSIALPPLCNAYIRIPAEITPSSILNASVDVNSYTRFLANMMLEEGVVSTAISFSINRPITMLWNSIQQVKPLARFFPFLDRENLDNIEGVIKILQQYSAIEVDINDMEVVVGGMNVISGELCKACKAILVRASNPINDTARRIFDELKNLGNIILLYENILDDQLFEFLRSRVTTWILSIGSGMARYSCATKFDLLLEHIRHIPRLSIGTHNVYINYPSPIDEASFLFKLLNSIAGESPELARTLIKAITLNCYELLCFKKPTIEPGSPPIMLLLTSPVFRYSKNVLNSIVLYGPKAEKILIAYEDIIYTRSPRLLKSKSLQDAMKMLIE